MDAHHEPSSGHRSAVDSDPHAFFITCSQQAAGCHHQVSVAKRNEVLFVCCHAASMCITCMFECFVGCLHLPHAHSRGHTAPHTHLVGHSHTYTHDKRQVDNIAPTRARTTDSSTAHVCWSGIHPVPACDLLLPFIQLSEELCLTSNNDHADCSRTFRCMHTHPRCSCRGADGIHPVVGRTVIGHSSHADVTVIGRGSHAEHAVISWVS